MKPPWLVIWIWSRFFDLPPPALNVIYLYCSRAYDFSSYWFSLFLYALSFQLSWNFLLILFIVSTVAPKTEPGTEWVTDKYFLSELKKKKVLKKKSAELN